MESSYSQLIRDLEKSAASIRAQGVQIDALDATIAELKRHTSNIEAVERNIGAIKDEVIAPIKKTLDENKRAGRFSILGFWVGLASIVIATAGSGYTMYQSKAMARLPTEKQAERGGETIATAIGDLRRDVDTLTRWVVGITSDYKPAKNETLLTTEFHRVAGGVAQDDKKELLVSPSGSLTAQLRDVGEDSLASGEDPPYVDLRFSLNGSQIGPTGQATMLQIARAKSKELATTEDFRRRAAVTTDVRLYEGDVLTVVGKNSFSVVRVFRQSSRVLPIGDKFDGVLLRVVQ